MDRRLKELRKFLNLTQQEFANRLGIKRNTLANYETGRNEPIGSVFSLICKEFNVNEDWLRNGNGSMFIEASTFSLDEYAQKKGLTVKEKKILRGFMDLEPHIRNAICAIFENATTLDDYDFYNDAPNTPQELEKLFPPVENNNKNTNIS